MELPVFDRDIFAAKRSGIGAAISGGHMEVCGRVVVVDRHDHGLSVVLPRKSVLSVRQKKLPVRAVGKRRCMLPRFPKRSDELCKGIGRKGVLIVLIF